MSETKSDKKKEDEPYFTLEQVKALLDLQEFDNKFIHFLKEYVEKEGKKMHNQEDALRIIINSCALITIFLSTYKIMTIAARELKKKTDTVDVDKSS